MAYVFRPPPPIYRPPLALRTLATMTVAAAAPATDRRRIMGSVS